MSDAPNRVLAADPDAGTPRLITHTELIGWMAFWAVRQHPYHRPEGLFEVTDAIAEASKAWRDGVESLRMWRVHGWSEIEKWLRYVLKDHAILLAWNTPRSGHSQQIVATSRYFGPKPEDDFIDIDALLRNISISTWRDTSL